MKKLLGISVVLILLDQITKYLAWYFVGNDLYVIIPGVLDIAPFHNTYLGWLGWWVGVVDEPSPFILIFLKHFFILFIIFVSYWYFCFISNKNRSLLNISFVSALAGTGGSFIDNLLFDGSWDFIFIFNALIFDFKDIYLVTHIFSILIYGTLLIPQCLKLNKEQRKDLCFSSFMRGVYTKIIAIGAW